MQANHFDVVLIDSLQLSCCIGYSAEERCFPQRVLLDVEVLLKPRISAQEGIPLECQLEDTVCYDQASTLIVQRSASRPWVLLEDLGEALCADIFEHFPAAAGVTLLLKKQVVAHTNWTGIRMRRMRA